MSVPWYLMAKGKGGGGYKTASGPIVSISDALAAPLRSLLVNIDPVQEGTGDPSPDNVRPISGWTGEKVTRTGKAVWGGLKMAEAFVRAYQYSLDTTAKTFTFSRSQQNAQGSWKLDLFNCPDGIDRLTYLFTYSNSGMNRSIVFDYSDGTQIQFQLPSTSGEKATLFGQTQAGKTIVRIQLNYYADALTTVYYDETTFVMGDVAREDMEPYQGDTYDIAFPTEAGTVYGGTLDVTNGVLTVDRAMVDLTVGMSGGTAGSGYVYYKEISNPKIVPNSQIAPIISEAYIPIRFNGVSGNANTIAVRDNGVVYVNTGSADIQPIGKAVYELATPITIPLTPQEISTLQGQNNVWADTGDVTVEYLSSGGANPDLMKLAVAFMGRK